MAQMPELLAMMREALFHTVFIGIETPEETALDAMLKKQNLRLPILEAIDNFNQYGLEVVSGIIMGLDTDTPQTGKAIQRFIDASNIPLLTINLLYALPKTALYDRLAKAGRLLPDEVAASRVSNVEFLMPYEQVMEMWFETITMAYAPENIFKRFRYQTERCFPNRAKVQQKASWEMVRYGLALVGRVLWHSGVKSSWRREFWKLCGPLLAQGRIEEVAHIGVVTYHLIRFTREIQEGKWEACFYADPSQSASPTDPSRVAPRETVSQVA
jgi:radical SAM superfamily enzyme YgiQ (UPF0313 family)